MKKRIFVITIISLFILSNLAFGQGYQFTDVCRNKATSVKNQARTGTCWCFATTAFIESELLRTGKGEFDLSEMFVVYQNYLNRLQDNYLRRGKGNIGEGSIAHMLINVYETNGIVPQEVYNGINYDSDKHDHTELGLFLEAVANSAIKIKKRSPEYYEIINNILDSYLGKRPEKFTYNGVEYTPKSFLKYLGINLSDYVELTSFNHIPFYKASVLEIPDNWDYGRLYNIPIDEFMEVINYALKSGYCIAWDGDVSEKGFSHKNGIAINPILEKGETEIDFTKTYKEKQVDQQSRQQGFETFATTDDHLMLLTGISKDQNGNIYYITKNSWGPDGIFGGYLNMSESYVRAKSISMLVNKNSIPKQIREKLGI
ncbi:MAG TPA: C1 family peptidase [Bacteroidales bacterium]|nr:aminopeptidase [Bacteroidales bacterium]HON54804.1 C1 family peptidase [Bacteroidales bacterium]HRT33680.1 C1 family peptidase [Bacteroidales bacterium]HRT83234.1 C1 family peptidase [Bacteroidales bacterium]